MYPRLNSMCRLCCHYVDNENNVKAENAVSTFRADIALIGLAVMGQNIILNMNDHGFVVSFVLTIHRRHFMCVRVIRMGQSACITQRIKH